MHDPRVFGAHWWRKKTHPSARSEQRTSLGASATFIHLHQPCSHQVHQLPMHLILQNPLPDLSPLQSPLLSLPLNPRRKLKRRWQRTRRRSNPMLQQLVKDYTDAEATHRSLSSEACFKDIVNYIYQVIVLQVPVSAKTAVRAPGEEGKLCKSEQAALLM